MYILRARVCSVLPHKQKTTEARKGGGERRRRRRIRIRTRWVGGGDGKGKGAF